MSENKNKPQPAPGQQIGRSWAGVASLSQSVWSQKEPRCAKMVFNAVQKFALEEFTRRKGEVRFLQVGANDGVWGDVLHPHIMGGNWTGLLIEPGDTALKRLRETYADVSSVEICDKAIWTENGIRTFYMVDGADALSSFSLETIMLHDPKYDDLAGMIRTVEVKTATLNSVAAEYSLEDADVVAVDAEGCDDIVLSTYDIEAHCPAFVMFEHVALSASSTEKLRQRLADADYTMIADRHDVLAIRKGTFEEHMTTFFEHVVHEARNN